MPQTNSPLRSRSAPAISVLVVATEGSIRARLAAQVGHALPSAQMHELAQLSDLVYRVAGSGVDLVVLDAEPLLALPLTPLMVQMLKGIQPALRIVCVVRAEAAQRSALPPSADASVTEACLCSWLRTTYGRPNVGLAAGPAPESPNL